MTRIEELQFFSAEATIGFVCDVDALYEQGESIEHLILGAGIPLLVFLIIRRLRGTPSEILITPVISHSHLETKALVKQNQIARIAQAGQCKLWLIGEPIEGGTAVGEGHVGNKT